MAEDSGKTIDFKNLSETYRTERKKATLNHLDVSFFSLAREYIKGLEHSFKEMEKSGESNSRKGMMLFNEINKSRKHLDQIYELRERKILLSALTGARGGKEPDNMTSREKELYEYLVESLTYFREHHHPPNMTKDLNGREVTKKIFEKETPMATPTGTPEEIKEDVPTPVVQEEMVKEALPEPSVKKKEPIQETKAEKADREEKTADEPKYITVRILDDIPEFTDMEKVYNLRKGDLITLPQRFVDIIVSKGMGIVV